MPPSRSRRPTAAKASRARARTHSMRDRLALGATGLRVSPFCLGMVERPEAIVAAYRAGINFFFLTADMHWPLYEGARQGLRALLRSARDVRRKVVVSVVSYVTQPEFCNAPFIEVLNAVPELEHVDVAVIGGSYANDFLSRHDVYRSGRPGGMTALGATFHERSLAVTAVNQKLVDIAFIRYNSAHAGAEQDVFPLLDRNRTSRLFGFKSTSAYLGPEELSALNVPKQNWRPTMTDHYRFALRPPQIDGILCSLDEPAHVTALGRALRQPPLTALEAEYLKTLSALEAGEVSLAR